MRAWWLSVLVGCLFLLSNAPLKKDRVVFQMQVGGKPLGKFIVWRQLEETKAEYWAFLDFHVKLGISYHGQQNMYARFENGILDSSYVSFRKDGKLKHQMICSRQEDYYQVFDNDTERRINGVIHNCSLNLYYEEPLRQLYSFSERDGAFKKVSHWQEGEYDVYTTRKNEHDTPSVFYYKDGVLQKVVVKYTLLTFEMVRMP